MHRRFHADHVVGDGLSLRVRRRKPTFTAAEMAALPPVPGFADPPLAGPPPPPLTDANYNLWSIWLEGVVADHVREIWIDTIRYAGDLEVRGRWFFRPVRWLDVGPATIDVRTLEVSRGPNEPWASEVTGRLLVTVHPFDVRDADGVDTLDRLSVAGDMRGRVHLVPMANEVLDGQGVEVEQAEARFDADLNIDHGVLRSGTRIHAEPFSTRVRGADLEFAASVEPSFVVGEDGMGRAELQAKKLLVSQDGYPRALATLVSAVLQSRELDLARPLSDATYALDFDGVRTDSLRYWHTRLPLAPRLALDSGPASAHGTPRGRGREARSRRPRATGDTCPFPRQRWQEFGREPYG